MTRLLKERRQSEMLKVDHIVVSNMEAAIRGMRNPLDSHSKSDSYGKWDEEYASYDFVIGEKDLELALKLVKAGTDHSKFMRQVFVSMDITAPLYWWKEMDQYKISATTNSESTMNTLHKYPLTKEMFSTDIDALDYIDTRVWNNILEEILWHVESLRQQYIETKDKKYWRQLIQILPSSFNQMRTWTANYAVLRNIYHARKNHKLSEWHEFCAVIEKLPYSILITCK